MKQEISQALLEDYVCMWGHAISASAGGVQFAFAFTLACTQPPSQPEVRDAGLSWSFLGMCTALHTHAIF